MKKVFKFIGVCLLLLFVGLVMFNIYEKAIRQEKEQEKPVHIVEYRLIILYRGNQEFDEEFEEGEFIEIKTLEKKFENDNYFLGIYEDEDYKTPATDFTIIAETKLYAKSSPYITGDFDYDKMFNCFNVLEYGYYRYNYSCCVIDKDFESISELNNGVFLSITIYFDPKKETQRKAIQENLMSVINHPNFDSLIKNKKIRLSVNYLKGYNQYDFEIICHCRYRVRNDYIYGTWDPINLVYIGKFYDYSFVKASTELVNTGKLGEQLNQSWGVTYKKMLLPQEEIYRVIESFKKIDC